MLYNQEFDEPVIVLLCAVDFSKAFNNIDQNTFITKLSDMGVPGWLLNVVCDFLQDRKLKARYRGVVSEGFPMPGGGPQGTLIGLFVFIVLINLCCNL